MVGGSSLANRGERSRAQASVIGFALVIGITLLATTFIVVFGAAALSDTQQEADIRQASHGMTQLDSRAAEVALSDTEIQTVDFSRGDGDFEVREGTGKIRILHVGYNDAGDTQTVYEQDLGEVVYTNDDEVLAYQAGGVWRKSPGGGATMVSPPEFHYRAGTLTLPVIRTRGSSGASGDVDATIAARGAINRTYPNQTLSYDDGTRQFDNPIQKGFISILITSEYYQGWSDYFRDRTDGNITEFPANQTVRLDLITLGATGPFPMPADQGSGGGSVRVQGMDLGHALTELRFTITPRDDQESEFKNLRWAMFAEEGQQKFEVALGGGGSVDCGDAVPVHIYYSSDGHATYQGWSGTTTVQCSGPDGNSGTREITLDLTNDTMTMTYNEISGSSLTEFNADINKNALQEPGTFDDHPDADTDKDHDPEGPIDYTPGATTDVDFVTNHYFSELGDRFDLRVSDQQKGGAAGVAEDQSSGVIFYEGGDRVVTYLHITENRIEISFE